MKLTKAQRYVVRTLQAHHATPYDQLNASHFRLGGRGMAKTLAALRKLGLVTPRCNEVYTPYGTTYFTDVFLTYDGKHLDLN